MHLDSASVDALMQPIAMQKGERELSSIFATNRSTEIEMCYRLKSRRIIARRTILSESVRKHSRNGREDVKGDVES